MTHLEAAEKLLAGIVDGITIECPDVNIDRVNHAIALMQRVIREKRKFNLNSWYGTRQAREAELTEESLHKCGSSACLLGWIASTSEWRDAGGFNGGDTIILPKAGTEESHMPHYLHNAHAGAEWFGISIQAANLLFLPTGYQAPSHQIAGVEPGELAEPFSSWHLAAEGYGIPTIGIVERIDAYGVLEKLIQLQEYKHVRGRVFLDEYHLKHLKRHISYLKKDTDDN